MSDTYFIDTGETDKQRLTILSALYNPPALRFLKNNGLKPGMTVLEVGCGTGHMSCDLATCVGDGGRVIAIDKSAEQVAIAKNTAQERGISNIEFIVHDVLKMDDLNLNCDFTYGRWVLEFLPHPEEAFEVLFRALNPGGVLAYEACNIKQSNVFSLPHDPVIEQWHCYGPALFKHFNCPLEFAYDDVYPILLALGLEEIDVHVNQAVLKTATEKSVYRLGLLSIMSALIENKIATRQDIDKQIAQLITLENSRTVTGFFHNLLLCGKKP